ncbi:MAG: hypothetical protein JFR38_08580 [Muribaculaceae bacterium]|nr:hypothetical protein [Muribaculaceae bacterium]
MAKPSTAMPAICRSDILKICAYLDDAARLYEALPMQSMKSRAHMIKQLSRKLKAKISTEK